MSNLIFHLSNPRDSTTTKHFMSAVITNTFSSLQSVRIHISPNGTRHFMTAIIYLIFHLSNSRDSTTTKHFMSAVITKTFSSLQSVRLHISPNGTRHFMSAIITNTFSSQQFARLHITFHVSRQIYFFISAIRAIQPLLNISCQLSNLILFHLSNSCYYTSLQTVLDISCQLLYI